jgi:single stranded DNA-binding protein
VSILLNRIILIGRLTKDPELRYTSNGTAVCTFTLAVDRPFAKEGQQKADFILGGVVDGAQKPKRPTENQTEEDRCSA